MGFGGVLGWSFLDLKIFDLGIGPDRMCQGDLVLSRKLDQLTFQVTFTIRCLRWGKLREITGCQLGRPYVDQVWGE